MRLSRARTPQRCFYSVLFPSLSSSSIADRSTSTNPPFWILIGAQLLTRCFFLHVVCHCSASHRHWHHTWEYLYVLVMTRAISSSFHLHFFRPLHSYPCRGRCLSAQHERSNFILYAAGYRPHRSYFRGRSASSEASEALPRPEIRNSRSFARSRLPLVDPSMLWSIAPNPRHALVVECFAKYIKTNARWRGYVDRHFLSDGLTGR